jgi:hypothetical protein
MKLRWIGRFKRQYSIRRWSGSLNVFVKMLVKSWRIEWTVIETTWMKSWVANSVQSATPGMTSGWPSDDFVAKYLGRILSHQFEKRSVVFLLFCCVDSTTNNFNSTKPEASSSVQSAPTGGWSCWFASSRYFTDRYLGQFWSHLLETWTKMFSWSSSIESTINLLNLIKPEPPGTVQSAPTGGFSV